VAAWNIKPNKLENFNSTLKLTRSYTEALNQFAKLMEHNRSFTFPKHRSLSDDVFVTWHVILLIGKPNRKKLAAKAKLQLPAEGLW